MSEDWGSIMRMGNREDLLAAAKRLLYEKGYARTTARDLAAASGVSLAAIGYHFGSTENLLHEAITDGFRAWRARFAEALHAADGPPTKAVAAIGRELDRLFEDERSLFTVFLEALALADRKPESAAQAAAAYEEDRVAIAALVAQLRGSRRRDDRVVASLLLAVVDGLFVQHLLQRDQAPPPSQVLKLLTPLLVPPEVVHR